MLSVTASNGRGKVDPAAVLAALTVEPLPCATLARHLGRRKSHVLRALQALEAAGRVKQAGRASATRWAIVTRNDGREQITPDPAAMETLRRHRSRDAEIRRQAEDGGIATFFARYYRERDRERGTGSGWRPWTSPDWSGDRS